MRFVTPTTGLHLETAVFERDVIFNEKHLQHIVKKISAILAKLEMECEIASLRLEIVVIIRECLEARKDSFGDWEKTHFSNAIGALGLNIHSRQQPTIAWLRLCLLDLERAVLPVTQRDPKFRVPDPSLRELSYERMVGAIDSIAREIG